MPEIDLNFQPASYPPEVFSYRHHMENLGLSKPHAKKLVKRFQEEKIVRSGTHQVGLTAFSAPAPFGSGTWLSIKRIDRSVIDDRQELASIMRVLKPGFGGFELLPAPARLVDTANQYHLFCFPVSSLTGLIDVPVGPVQAHPSGFDFRELEFSEGHPRVMVLMATGGLGDWRQLYERKESRWPGCEAALYCHESPEHPWNGHMLVLRDPSLRFPFGFAGGLVTDSALAASIGAVQRGLEGYSKR